MILHIRHIKSGLKYLTPIAFVMLLLCLPLAQKETGLFKTNKLGGYQILNNKADFNLKNWFSGTFQEQTEKYLNDHIGFHTSFIKLKNQIAYSLYNKVKAAGVILGKENYLYEENYIKAYYGLDFLGKDSIRHITKNLEQIADTLLTKNTKLLVCIAAGKGSFYPEYFPNRYKTTTKSVTNNEFFAKMFDSIGINYVDFNKWFLDIKDTCRYLLYPKYGIHWSEYGATLAMDSLIKKSEELLSKNMVNINIHNIETTTKLKGNDYDIAKALNLIFQLPTEPMAYPKFIWTKDSSSYKPKVIVVSDSFFWQMYSKDIFTNCFNEGEFWYYFNEIHPGRKNIEEINYKEELEKSDLIILMATEATIARFPFGFIEKTCSVYNIPTQ